MSEEQGPEEPKRRGPPGRRAAERAARLRRAGEAPGGSGDATAPIEGGIRLNKLLASRGIGARRKCDALVQAGSVRVNGRIIKEPGTQVMPDRDLVEVHGRPIPGRAALRYLMIHKPVGVITTLDDPEGRPTVRTLLPPGPRLFPVGRLDAETSGLIIATNDGELAHHLMHPRYGVRKLYRARLDRPPDADQVRRLRSGVMFEPGRVSAPCEVRVRNARLERAEIEIVLHEGRYRQVRRMCEAVGLRVSRLHRPAYGPLKLGTLPRGAWRELSPDEVRRLKAASARPVPRVTRKRVATVPAPGASEQAGRGEAAPNGEGVCSRRETSASARHWIEHIGPNPSHLRWRRFVGAPTVVAASSCWGATGSAWASREGGGRASDAVPGRVAGGGAVGRRAEAQWRAARGSRAAARAESLLLEPAGAKDRSRWASAPQGTGRSGSQYGRGTSRGWPAGAAGAKAAWVNVLN